MAHPLNSIYQAILTQLDGFPPPLLPPGHSHDARLTAQIAALQVHPTIEAAMHILNHDLPSAHFLVRHMQSAPAVEGMMLHGVLHRIEGDYDNARAWYSDVAEDITGQQLFQATWRGGKEEALSFVGEVERLNKQKIGKLTGLSEASKLEIMNVLRWCEEKFGTGVWEDASSAWVRPDEKIKTIGREMTTGADGYRKF